MGTTITNASPAVQALLQTPLVDETKLITRNWWPFYSRISALVSSGALFQPVFRVTDYGADQTGKKDASGGIQSAYKAAVAAGGGIVYLEPGTYKITTPILLASTAPITFLGAGMATVLLRSADMPQGVGMIDGGANAANVTFENFVVDGDVTVSTGVSYAQIAGDPRNPILTQNTSFWLHDGCNSFTWNSVQITHTGGYSVLVDAFNSDITDLKFSGVELLNNRPHLFGINPANLNFGSWTGGILLHANGLTSNATVRRVQFQDCSARRVTGNAFWAGHLYGFDTMFEGISFDNIIAEDCGRDLIQLGATLGTRINGVSGRRIGYITSDDTSPSVARFEPGQWAVAIDCGPCFGTVISNVHLTSVNGGCFDIDGMRYTTLSNFSARVPLPGEPEYDEDGIGLAGWAGSVVAGGPSAAYGILMAPAGYGPFEEGNHEISAGSLVNFSAGAVRMYGSHQSMVTGLNIWHPPVNNGAPIQIGNLAADNMNRSFGNVVSNNRIQYDPAVPAPCIQEIAGPAPFQPTDSNIVLGNAVVSTTGATEFAKDPTSASVASVTETIDFATYNGKLVVTRGYITGS